MGTLCIVVLPMFIILAAVSATDTNIDELNTELCINGTMDITSDVYLSGCCSPNYEMVPVDPDALKMDPNVDFLFYPKQLRVKRCSGLCTNQHKECRNRSNPIKKQLRVTVLSTRDTVYKDITMDEHRECACECTNKEICSNEVKMVWDDEYCKCMCRDMKAADECKGKFIWESCQCLPVADVLIPPT